MALISGNNQTAPAGRLIRGDITLRVADANGNPFANATIILTPGNGGSVSPSIVLTNSSGVALVRGWTLGTTAGVQTLTAQAGNGSVNPTVVITATATGVRTVTFGDPTPDEVYQQR